MKKQAISPYYPILLNIQGKKCLVIGGGEVALRKAKTILEHGANVVSVSPTFCAEMEALAKQNAIRTICRDYQSGDLDDVYMVIAATDDAKVNEKAAVEARKKKILVNVVDKPDISDFIVPSYFRRGDIIVAVSTSGKSPALARKIKSELAAELKTEYAQLAVIASEVRSEIKKNGVEVSAEQWQQALDLDSLIELIKRGRNKEAREIMLARLKVTT
ncbi:MAG TPA: bifunctional precorrin-2 dehydrogenase/sirohydrochlorin ferrochelatase [Dehalococcoidia bacterium]|jgi:siroheme synthase-like protein